MSEQANKSKEQESEFDFFKKTNVSYQDGVLTRLAKLEKIILLFFVFLMIAAFIQFNFKIDNSDNQQSYHKTQSAISDKKLYESSIEELDVKKNEIEQSKLAQKQNDLNQMATSKEINLDLKNVNEEDKKKIESFIRGIQLIGEELKNTTH